MLGNAVVQGIVINSRDITERKQLEEQLLQTHKMEAIGLLAGGIAHDFNNILVPIIGYVELAMMRIPPEDKSYAYLQSVRAAADRATELTRQILAFSRKQVMQMQVIDLNTVVAEFEKMLHRLIREDIDLQAILAPDLHLVRGDKGQIAQVLLNLAVNARDAMPHGGKLTIETANVYLDETYVRQHACSHPPGNFAMLAVSDTGYGMDAETQKRIFEPFFTTKEHGKGTGLGLATVFGIVKQHDGNIWVYSEPGKGTTFKIYLPRAQAAGDALRVPDVSIPATNGTETILVVEDEAMVRQFVCETLAEHGYKVIDAQGAHDALQCVNEQPDAVHLLLTDLIMPEMSGHELYQKVTAVRPDVKVLYMSGYTDSVVIRHGLTESGSNFLQKPVTVQNLTAKVRQVLNTVAEPVLDAEGQA